MAHPAESAFVGAIIGLVTALVLFPTRVGRLLAPAGGAVVDGLRWASESFPYWAFILTVFLGTMIVTVFVAYEFARVGYAAVRRAGPRTRRVVGFVTPNTPIGKAAFAFCFTILFLIGSVWALPYVIGDIGANSPISDSSDLSNSSNPQEALEDANERLDDVLDGDAATHGDGADGARTAEREYDRPRPDGDGDRLKDSWERAGETPAGVELPNADPDRMDIYLQINYATYTRPLSQQEIAQLKRVFAEMPVENPDGSTGITLHIDDEGPYGGALGSEAVYDGTGDDETTRFYTAGHLGDRRCRYHQIVVGQVDHPTLAGRASAPGFAGYVQSKQNDAYQQARSSDDPRQVSSRVHVITHELLHNVVGEVDGSTHTSEGWLAPSATPDDAFLSDAAASELNGGLAGSGYYQEKLC
ncbi:hypothetical protein BV210_13970 [Halorientalis sp. IM1011]|uniref:hypothetical protein n=1 Tax=Halorientalis sp. IM1011 TaxID=1932360 RepID=UPI00097CD5B6|nr:hypothetical protein [Halorientalis sp. IM1011]AQL43743.1 hypothetical protein BV210_13970 [Halorientalis sp. IM1011]